MKIDNSNMIDGKDSENVNTLEELAGKEELEVFVAQNTEGKNIICIQKDDYQYLLNSQYADDELIKAWCNQEELDNPYAIAVVVGMANGEYIRALRRHNENMMIIAYEPSYSIAYLNAEVLEGDDLKNDENLFIAFGEEGIVNVYSMLGALVGYENVKYTKLLISPNYELVFPEIVKQIEDIYIECINNVYFNRNTMLVMGQKMTGNMANNIMDFLGQYALADLIHSFEKLSKENIPAIVVSAGPSLDKNIKELRRAKGKAFIIAVDSALNSLGNEGIFPDITVTVDPHKELELFEHSDMKYIPMVFALTSNAAIKELHQGMRIYQNNADSLMDRYLQQYRKEKASLESGGSVANDACSLAHRLGFQTIIFVGQDLAYPNDQGHAKGMYGDKKDNDIKNSGKEFFEVEDIYGGKVKTEYNMNMYRLWFERAVQVYSDIKFIDATEGGAKINGMEIMTLSDAIDRECRSEEIIDFSKFICDIDKMFSEEERVHIIAELAEFEAYMDTVRNRIQKGKEAYKKLDYYKGKKIYKGKEFEKCIRKISEINEWVSNDDEMKYFSSYVAKEYYQINEKIFDTVDSVEQELTLLVDSGIKMLDALLLAIDKVVEEMQGVISSAKALSV